MLVGAEAPSTLEIPHRTAVPRSKPQNRKTRKPLSHFEPTGFASAFSPFSESNLFDTGLGQETKWKAVTWIADSTLKIGGL